MPMIQSKHRGNMARCHSPVADQGWEQTEEHEHSGCRERGQRGSQEEKCTAQSAGFTDSMVTSRHQQSNVGSSLEVGSKGTRQDCRSRGCHTKSRGDLRGPWDRTKQQLLRAIENHLEAWGGGGTGSIHDQICIWQWPQCGKWAGRGPPGPM